MLQGNPKAMWKEKLHIMEAWRPSEPAEQSNNSQPCECGHFEYFSHTGTPSQHQMKQKYIVSQPQISENKLFLFKLLNLGVVCYTASYLLSSFTYLSQLQRSLLYALKLYQPSFKCFSSSKDLILPVFLNKLKNSPLTCLSLYTFKYIYISL